MNTAPKLLPAEWEVIEDVAIMDPDGWDRRDFAKSWAEPLDHDEWLRRMATSTIAVGGISAGWKRYDPEFVEATKAKWAAL